jgi:hypothetical protein
MDNIASGSSILPSLSLSAVSQLSIRFYNSGFRAIPERGTVLPRFPPVETSNIKHRGRRA